MTDIINIKLQLSKIKELVKKDREQDKKIIEKLYSQLKQIDLSIKNLDRMAKKIKGGGLKCQKIKKGGFLKTIKKNIKKRKEKKKGEKIKKKKLQEKQRKKKVLDKYVKKNIYIGQIPLGGSSCNRKKKI